MENIIFKWRKYKGEFSESLFNGKGIYKYNNGDIYNGEQKKGKKMEKVFLLIMKLLFLMGNLLMKKEGKWKDDNN